jgi:predicted alpha/beta superfamily hydrolase
VKPPRPSSTPPAFVSSASALATDYAVFVAAPEGAAAGPWPAVVVLDGDYFFDAAVAATRALRAEGAISPVGIIGIGYRKAFGDPGNRRGRDYTPTAAAEEPTSGGAAAFLAHLGSSLWPELQRRYPIDAERSVLAGHSLSALFVLYALFQPEPLFRRAIAGAPSIWWDNRSLLTHLSHFRDRQASLPAELFIGVGADETPSMLGDLALFDRQLAARPFADLRVTKRTYPDRDHYNLVPDLFTGGLRELFGGST